MSALEVFPLKSQNFEFLRGNRTTLAGFAESHTSITED